MAESSGLRGLGIAPKLSPIGLELALEQSGWYPSELILTPPRAIVDQGDIPCCVSCAIATCVEILNPTLEQLAPLFHFYMFNSMQHGGPPESFEGMTLGDGLNVLATYGVCLRRYYPTPYTKDGAKTPPDEQAVADARVRSMPFDNNREVGSFTLLSDDNRVNEWKRTLLGNRPILIGLYQTDQYGCKMARLQGNLNPAQPHAVAVFGYRESERSFIVQDSKGSEFAIGGQWWLPYNMVESSVVEQAYAVGYPPAR